MTPAAIEQAVSRTGAQYLGDLRTMLAEVGKVYAGQLAAKDAALAAKDEPIVTKDHALAAHVLTIAELRRRAEVAEVAEAPLERRREADQARLLRQAEIEQARRQAEEAAQAAQIAAHSEGAATVAPAEETGLWGRVWRWWTR